MAIASPPEARVYTADDLLYMPDDCRFELIRGELIPLPPSPGGEQGNVTQLIGARASVYVADHDLGYTFAAETGFKIAHEPDTVRGPDWAFVRKDRLEGQLTKKHAPMPPDVAMETRSTSDTRPEVAYKVEIWLQSGVTLVWEVDPQHQRVTVHRAGRPPMFLIAADTLSGEDIIPGFELPLKRVFKES